MSLLCLQLFSFFCDVDPDTYGESSSESCSSPSSPQYRGGAESLDSDNDERNYRGTNVVSLPPLTF